MDDETELTPWQEVGGIRHNPERSQPVPRLSPLPVEIRRANIYDLCPVDRDEFFASVGPCLALTGGIGMTADDQRTWLEAAFKALTGIPIRLLERGAEAAMKRADHPSKIVPAIMKEIGEDWDWRKRFRPQPTVPQHDLRQAADTLLTREAARAILQEEGIGPGHFLWKFAGGSDA